ncbi:hypothetical protein, partial [Mycolicibacterium mageritense]|uniref:hypothetical protein n=1 Tax=Mycolicibacterium mageritense TaxID=53462 RepID=UPI003F68684D
MRGTTWVGFGVVDIAALGRAVTAGEHACHVPHPHPGGQFRRGPVPRLGLYTGRVEVFDGGAGGDQIGQ